MATIKGFETMQTTDDGKNVKTPVSAKCVATITRGDTGKVEIRTMAYWDRNPIRRIAWETLEKTFPDAKWSIWLRDKIERKSK